MSDVVSYSFTNECFCIEVSEDGRSMIESPDCYHDCWSITCHEFADEFGDWIESNPTSWWKVERFPLWDRTASGYFRAEEPVEFLTQLTSKLGEWRLECRLEKDQATYDQIMVAMIYHHDVPTGGRFEIRKAGEQS